MGLLPHPVAISELEIDPAFRDQIRADIDVLLSDSSPDGALLQMKLPPVECKIEEVSFFAAGDQRRFIITGEEGSLAMKRRYRPLRFKL